MMDTLDTLGRGRPIEIGVPAPDFHAGSDGKKVGGTLVECVSRGDRVDSVILGVGVNLNVRREALAGALGA